MKVNVKENTIAVANTKGFSLIELMIVVAIIGLLAAIGIPQYAKFQAKARQSEAKGHMTALYTAEESFKAEWNGYSSNLNSIGFGVTGSGLRYTAGFAATACTITGRTAGAPAEAAGNTQAHLTTVTPVAGTIWNANAITYNTAVTTFPAITCTATTFRAFVGGDPKNTPGTANTTPDMWFIDETKAVTQTAVGI
jgi:type IV pilus assembly protein PilA